MPVLRAIILLPNLGQVPVVVVQLTLCGIFLQDSREEQIRDRAGCWFLTSSHHGIHRLCSRGLE